MEAGSGPDYLIVTFGIYIAWNEKWIWDGDDCVD